MGITASKPKIQRTHVAAHDPDTGERKYVTLYGDNATPERIIEALKSLEKPARRKSSREPAAA
jgi:hypothetical protein